MKRILKSVLPICIVLLLASAAGSAELKLGHIDLQRLVSQSDAGKGARENFKAKNEKFQAEINTRAERLKKMKEELDAEIQGVPKGQKIPQSIVDKDKDYGAQTREQQRLLSESNEELKVYDAELTRKVLDEFSPILAEYAKSNSYDYIFRNADSIAFASDKHDLTDTLIKEFNKKRKK